MFNTNGKNSSSVLILIYKQCFNYLNNNVSALFTFALAFIMPQVSGGDLHKHEKWLRKEYWVCWKKFNCSNWVSIYGFKLLDGWHFTKRKIRIAHGKNDLFKVNRSIGLSNHPTFLVFLDTNVGSTGTVAQLVVSFVVIGWWLMWFQNYHQSVRNCCNEVSQSINKWYEIAIFQKNRPEKTPHLNTFHGVIKMVPSHSLLYCESSMSAKENPEKKS